MILISCSTCKHDNKCHDWSGGFCESRKQFSDECCFTWRDFPQGTKRNSYAFGYGHWEPIILDFITEDEFKI